MAIDNYLEKFHTAHREHYAAALQQIKNSKKTSHWMWYIFPQVAGLGLSETSRLYALKNISEATGYLNDPVLGAHLLEISAELLKLHTSDPVAVMGSIDSVKLKSSMTLFASVDQTNPVFQNILDKFFNGSKDELTIQLLDTGK